MAGIDGYDWSIFGGNPAPGDPDGVRAMAARLRDLADEVAQQNRLLRSVSSDSHSVWTGPAAEAFRPHLDQLPGQLHKLTTSYHDAADALDGYWPRLAAAQQQAVNAWHKAQAAHGQVQTAQGQVGAANQAASSAAGTYNQAVTAASAAPPDPTGATLVHLSSLQNAYQTASNQLAAANSALSAANANLQAAHAQADSARSQAKAAARHVAAGLDHASDAGIHNPHHSLWGSIKEDVGGAAGHLVHFAKHRASDIGHVAGEVTHVAEGGVHWVDHHAGDIATAASLALGPAGLLLTSEGRHLVSEALHAAEPGLIVASDVLGATSAVLAVAGMALAPVGVGEVIDVANEGVLGMKTASDAALLYDGYKPAEVALAFDGVGLATMGTSRAFTGAAETAEATAAVEPAASGIARDVSGMAAAGDQAVEGGAESGSLSLAAEESWGNANTIEDHLLRHGADFGATSAEDYADQASQFLQRGTREQLPTKIDPKTGVIRMYDPATNTFGAYNANGTTRTFYTPAPSVHGYPSNWDYWRDQPGNSPWVP